ncbi:MAG TPA: hypothetical protein PKV91_08660, partial [Bacillota bacterium]|nr:hypothetical protein [Bacillota bacterium]HOJ84035.1 hypothetical protein [Bacillota bacterium]HOL16264.1 hypothetical protein [Bacillota bacterium]HPZ12406.1 hypothetical protein [Bacillota bacterium]HQE10415.1 hypothetical protein [Bacillota bacterium]
KDKEPAGPSLPYSTFKEQLAAPVTGHGIYDNTERALCQTCSNRFSLKFAFSAVINSDKHWHFEQNGGTSLNRRRTL